ncbi:glyoxalase [Cohnella endophytica]|uniref:Glyoxalase n=1 Tax=Cohnella endophytica TaxID=2419778 RepID=A0A494XAR1_9BACL|nr:VOC family protein [Cohnella endophytica]RKP47907.1 glyoxalase [Cohnella endophytica]
MKIRLEGITVLASDVSVLAGFYREVIGFKTVIEEDHYVEFENSGIRMAICSKSLMAENTNQHHSFIEERKGQAFELNFECNSPEAVYDLFKTFTSKGATAISEPKTMSWGHTTGFFADPEGNIHSIFAINPNPVG